jgi:isoleucyl-tRNA synthetase
LAALKSTVLVLSPIVPFVTERIWQNAVRGLEPGAAESVHHAEWPEPPAEWRDEPLLRRTETVRNAIRLGLKVRAQAQVRVRQPLAALYVVSPESNRSYNEQKPVIQSELNVKEIRLTNDRSTFFQRKLKVDWKTANAHLKRESGRFRGIFEALDDRQQAALASQLATERELEVPGFDQPVPANLFRLEEAPNPRYGVAEENGLLVALDMELTDALKREGLVRDLVRNLQVARKDAGLSVSQRIELGLATKDATIGEAIREHEEYIKDELLATSLEHGVLEPFRAKTDVNLDGSQVSATLRW